MKTMTDASRHSAPAATSDAQLMADTLALLGERGQDIAPAVFARFISQHSASAPLFRVVDVSQPPHGCGQMVFEILSVLQDHAEGKPYVQGYLRDLVSGHKGFGVDGFALYSDFMASLLDEIGHCMGAEWTPERAEAWSSQREALLALLKLQHPK